MAKIYQPIPSDMEVIAHENLTRGMVVAMVHQSNPVRLRERRKEDLPVAVMARDYVIGSLFKVRDGCLTRSGIKRNSVMLMPEYKPGKNL